MRDAYIPLFVLYLLCVTVLVRRALSTFSSLGGQAPNYLWEAKLASVSALQGFFLVAIFMRDLIRTDWQPYSTKFVNEANRFFTVTTIATTILLCVHTVQCLRYAKRDRNRAAYLRSLRK